MRIDTKQGISQRTTNKRSQHDGSEIVDKIAKDFTSNSENRESNLLSKIVLHTTTYWNSRQISRRRKLIESHYSTISK